MEQERLRGTLVFSQTLASLACQSYICSLAGQERTSDPESTTNYYSGNSISFFFNFFFNVYLFLRQSMNRGGAERGGDTESEPGSRFRAVSTEPDVGLELTARS